MARSYIQVAYRLGWLLGALEQYLSGSENRSKVDETTVERSSGGRMPTRDEAAAVIEALHAIGVLQEQDGSYQFSSDDFRLTHAYRSGVREALEYVHNIPTEGRARLCVALPPGIPEGLAKRIRREAIDLRAAILDVIASAERTLVLASPFWDNETIAEIGPLLVRRMDADVNVRILGRFHNESQTDASANLFGQMAHRQNFSVLSWFDDAIGPVQTFHFKVVVADEGRQAYLGTANLTASGLRSRMEIGMILFGESARQLFQVVDMTVSLGRTMQRGQTE